MSDLCCMRAWVVITRAYRYELDPNDVQRTSFAKHAGAARFAWNWALARRIAMFAASAGPERFSDAMKDHRAWNAEKRTKMPWALDVSKCAPQEAFRDLDKAYGAFRRGAGFPKFKAKGRHDSFRMTGQIHVRTRAVQLPRIGRVRTKERTGVVGRILSATVRSEAGRWFVAIAVEQDISPPTPRPGDIVGMDLGLHSFAVLSSGERFEAPRPYANAHDSIRKLEREVSRRKKGSKNRQKSIARLAKAHWAVANRRRDFLQKLSTSLAKTKSAVVIEDLHVGGMVKNRRLARSVSDQGWAEFRRMLSYKSAWYGMQLIVADRFFPSSKRCHACGYLREQLLLSEREWSCPCCATTLDRDLNAALNLQQYGTASRAGTQQTPVEDPSGSGTARAGLRVKDRRKRKRTATA